MTPDPFSWIAIAIIAASLWLAWSGRFLAVGSIAVANLLVHLLAAIGPRIPREIGGRVYEFSAVRYDLSLHPDAVAAADPWVILQAVTHMFTHASGYLHLGGNLLILLAFALPFEERIGPRRFVIIYVASGLLAAAAQIATMWGQETLLLGASGAVFGIIGAFAAAYPNLIIPLPLPLIVFMIFVRMRVIVAAVAFAAAQVVLQSMSQYNPGDNTAYFAHLGGLVGGLALGRLVVRGPMAPTRPADTRLDLDRLAPYAGDEAGRAAIDHMRANIDEPDVFEAWLERFLRSARSPDTGAPLALRKGQLVSNRGERFDVRVTK